MDPFNTVFSTLIFFSFNFYKIKFLLYGTSNSGKFYILLLLGLLSYDPSYYRKL